jgi:hypothetical protein
MARSMLDQKLKVRRLSAGFGDGRLNNEMDIVVCGDTSRHPQRQFALQLRMAADLRRQLAVEPGYASLSDVDPPSRFVEDAGDVVPQHAVGSPDHLVRHLVRKVEENAGIWAGLATGPQNIEFRR